MKKHKIFEGVGTALITPFRDGKIDFCALHKLIDMQVEGGADAIVICGTTGECATLSDYERYSLYEASKDMVGGRTKLIFGTGTNDTSAMIRHSKEAEKYSPDGILVVSPYYNKGTEMGIAEHYEALIKRVDLPIIIYNVPSRTGVNLSLSTLKKLSSYESIVGIKEAGDSMSRYTSLSSFGDELPLYAGNDNHFYQSLTLNGAGVISVISNVLCEDMKRIYTLTRNGEWESARLMQCRMLELIDALFYETNPAPIKWLMSTLGLVSDEIRLPLTMPSHECQRIIADRYRSYTNNQ